MSYGFCYIVVLSVLLIVLLVLMCQFFSALLCHKTYSSTLFSPSTQYAVKYISTGYSYIFYLKPNTLLNARKA